MRRDYKVCDEVRDKQSGLTGTVTQVKANKIRVLYPIHKSVWVSRDSVTRVKAVRS